MSDADEREAGYREFASMWPRDTMLLLHVIVANAVRCNLEPKQTFKLACGIRYDFQRLAQDKAFAETSNKLYDKCGFDEPNAISGEDLRQYIMGAYMVVGVHVNPDGTATWPDAPDKGKDG